MRIGVPRETAAGERRVALVPEVVGKLVPAGFEVLVQRGAGQAASFPDAAYEEAGARLVDDWADADAVVKVQKPSEEEAGELREGQVLIGFLQPLTDREGAERPAQRGVVGFAMQSIPGRPAPELIPASAVAAMRPGSVVVDLAAEAGGNCELTEPGEEVVREGVTLVGLTNLPSTMPFHASQLYARNVAALLNHLAPEGTLALDWDDEITAGACVTRKQEVAA